MALQVWLPLNGNLENKGLSNITITPIGGSDSYTDGKIGKCLTPSSRYYNISPITLGSKASICCWTKTTVNSKMSWVLASTASNKLNLYEDTYYSLNTGDGSSNTFQNNGSNVDVLHDGLWHHFVVTFGNNKAQLYIDGEYAGTTPTFRNPACTNSKIKLAGGYNNNHSRDWNGSLNDFRVYDHCLSPKEIHEIVKGLVLHYKLNNIPNKNLISSLIQYHPENYNAYSFNLSENFEEGQTYTFQLWDVNVSHSAKTEAQLGISIYWGGGSITLKAMNGPSWFNNGHADYIKFTITITSAQASHANAVNAVIRIYNSVPSASGTRYMYIKAIKIEKGNTATVFNGYDQIESIVYDSSGYKNNGSIIGALTTNTNSPRYNYCIYMNNTGTTNHIETNQIEVSDNIFTVSFWVKASKSTNQVFVADPKIVIGTLNSLLYVVKTSSKPFTTTNFVNNEWNHIVVIRNGTTYKAYINGIAETRSGSNHYYAHSASKLWLLNRSTNSTYAANASMSDFRIYATELSENDIKELYNNPANIDNEGNIFGYEFEESNNNMLFEENYGIISKQWLRGLGKYIQTNCQCTLEDEGYKIYRPANLASGSTNKTCGGLVLRNYDNQFGLQKNHTYIIEFDVKGQSSVAAVWTVNFNMGNASEAAGLNPSPSNVVISNPVVDNFNSDTYKHCSYKFTINDEIYKTCVSGYGSFVSGETYVSYRDFKFGYEYTATGSLGTDIYIKNLSMRDVTTNTNININKNGIVTSQMFNEFDNTTKFYSSGVIKSTKIIEK